jgi:molecular chaperone GrpE
MGKRKRKKKQPDDATETATDGQVASAESTDARSPKPEEPKGDAAALLERPEDTCERLAEELEAEKDKCLRLAAEFDNFRKRMIREREEIGSRGQATVVSSILDSLDDLGRVASLDPDTANIRDVISGVELVERKLLHELEGVGLTRIGAEGEVFDPNDHEAISTAPAPNGEKDNLVSEVFQVGYRFGRLLLRPARVQVFVTPDDVDTGE